MQWGHIKTLFIICFLILNIFLVQQMLEKRENGELAALADTTQTRLETLKANYEGIEENLSEENIMGSYLYLRPRRFSDEDLAGLSSLGNQETALINNRNMLISELEEPVPVPVEGTSEQIESTVKEVALLAENYTFWEHEENSNVLIFFQENESRPVYYNQSALLLVFLNEENEIFQYVQTEMEEVEKEQEEKELTSSVNAVFYLSNLANELLIGDEVTDATLGYHTLTPLPDSVHVLVPSWSILVNNDRNYLVNAVEVGALSRDEMSFLQETLMSYNSMVGTVEEAVPVIKEAKENFETILDTTTWSEENGD